MSYQLQPDLQRIQNPALPPEMATDNFFAYPEAARNVNFGSRPNTMLYGTAPYMAGKGSPAQFVDVSDELRPQSTTRFNVDYVNNYEKQLFPMDRSMPAPPVPNVMDPRSSRSELQNDLFDLRYNKKYQ